MFAVKMNHKSKDPIQKCQKKQGQKQAVQAKIVGTLPTIGRPRNPNAKTKLERQREYRRRAKEIERLVFGDKCSFKDMSSADEVDPLQVAEELDNDEQPAIAKSPNVNNPSASGGINCNNELAQAVL
ncbi:uncharacterized protein LOC130669935 isoform X2 [Microplitis mediator]|uniref:uncharacterized protein LOC130669935 isoform X2 n=1 Tax=Microplitis mediator TaxID=375433 RepID=UPI0025521654|nr:uncharacterized protein LOC130669935 isoform X2 [Microplitis mediator]